MEIILIRVPAGLCKKIEALAKQKQCELVAKWQDLVANCSPSASIKGCMDMKEKGDHKT